MNDKINNKQKYLLTGVVVLIAVLLVIFKYLDYLTHPWTRDGQVRAEVIQISPQVTGQIIELPIIDNQFVKTGDILFKIDQRSYIAAFRQAEAQLESTIDNYNSLLEQVESSKAQVEVARHSTTQAESAIKEADATIERNKAEYERQLELLPQKATSLKAVQQAKANYDVSVQQRLSSVASLAQAQATLLQAQANLKRAEASVGGIGDNNGQIRAAKAQRDQAELNLEHTVVRAPVDGYVTNLNLRMGSQAIANKASLALVDINSYWVSGFFKENAVANICAGHDAVVTLMTYPDEPLNGKVRSIGWGISQQNGSAGADLLPTINPTFEWIRLAQRIPVEVKLTDVPEHIALRVGTTASVLVYAKECNNPSAVLK